MQSKGLVGMDEDNTPDFQDLGDLEGGDPRVFDVLENGAGDDAIDTLAWDVLGQFMGVGDEVYILPRLIVHADVRGRVRDPSTVAGVPLSRLAPRSKLDHPRIGNPGQLFDEPHHCGDVDVRCESSASSDFESRRAPLDDAQDPLQGRIARAGVIGRGKWYISPFQVWCRRLEVRAKPTEKTTAVFMTIPALFTAVLASCPSLFLARCSCCHLEYCYR